MSDKSSHTIKSIDLHNYNEYFIYINRLVLFYTFIGVTYLLFVKSTPNCCGQSSNDQLTDLLRSNNANHPTINTPIISFGGSNRHLLSTNTTILSVKRNYEAIENLYSMLPSGMVMIWYGSIATIPPGWALCDGTNGTPDLRDKFVIGGGNTYDLDDYGGRVDIVLTINEMPVHAHNISSSNVISSTQNPHTHARGTFSLSTQSHHTHSFSATSGSTGSHSHSFSETTSTVANHRHSFSDTSTSNGNHRHSFSDTSTSNGNHRHSFSDTSTSNGNHHHTMTQIALSTHDGNGDSGNWALEYLNDGNWAYPTDYAGLHTHSVSGNTGYAGSHTHDVSGNTGYAGSHTHDVGGNTGYTGTHSHTVSGTTNTVPDHTHSVVGTTDSSGSHSHSISGSSSSDGGHFHTVNGFTDSVGSGNTINILNPYYAAYYIMKVPYLFPSDDPTQSPTLTPSTSPTNNPSISPTNNPSKNPTFNPSLNPTISPTLAPSISPTLTPTLTPSMSPSTAPSKSPTLAPTSSPSFSPSNNPSSSPSSHPASYPTHSPTNAPSLAPSLTPSAPPTTFPSLAPSISPSTSPTISPSFPPTIAPSIAPSLAPSKAPTKTPSSSPSVSPTAMPTPTCWDAKYKHVLIKSSNLNRNDILYSGESMVSPNCRFILTMKEEGNLILSGLVGKYQDPYEKDEQGQFTNNASPMRLHIGWETNTTIENHSGESIATLMLKSGTLIVEEHEFINVPEFEPIELWHSNQFKDRNELILELTDNGCLRLNEYYGSINTDTKIAIWFVCAELERHRIVKDGQIYEKPTISITPTEAPVIFTTILQNENNDEFYNINKYDDDVHLFMIWNIIISVILFLFLYFCIKQAYDNCKSTNISMQQGVVTSNQIKDNNLDIGGEDDDHEQDKAIELWSMETPNVTDQNHVATHNVTLNN